MQRDFVLLCSLSHRRNESHKKQPVLKRYFAKGPIIIIGIRRRPTLPGGRPPSTIGAGGLNCCVRNGNRWDPSAIATGNLSNMKLYEVRARSIPCYGTLPGPLLLLFPTKLRFAGTPRGSGAGIGACSYSSVIPRINSRGCKHPQNRITKRSTR